MNNQAAITLLKGLEQSLDDYCELNDEGKTVFRMAIMALEQSKRKTGRWGAKEVVDADSKIITQWQSCKCSECGRYDTRPYLYYFAEPNFCSFCGAKMTEGEQGGHQ